MKSMGYQLTLEGSFVSPHMHEVQVDTNEEKQPFVNMDNFIHINCDVFIGNDGKFFLLYKKKKFCLSDQISECVCIGFTFFSDKSYLLQHKSDLCSSTIGNQHIENILSLERAYFYNYSEDMKVNEEFQIGISLLNTHPANMAILASMYLPATANLELCRALFSVK